MHKFLLTLFALCAVALAVAQSPRPFVLYAADGVTRLGYGQRAEGAMPPALRARYAAAQRTQWFAAASADGRPPLSRAPMSPVPPLLEGWVRHQEAPYNALCPHYIYDDGTVSPEPCVVGCVATAMESIISYYGRMLTLPDTLHGWQIEHYAVADILPGERLDAGLIRPVYAAGDYTEEEASAVARLSLWLGMMTHMRWGVTASGTYVSAYASELPRTLGFGYVRYLDSYLYPPETWRELLMRELREGRPVLYAGDVMAGGGHAFVLDGYDAQGYVHVNWGYDGNYDGYFPLELLNFAVPLGSETETDIPMGYACNQEAVFVHPDSLDIVLPDTLERTGYEVRVEEVRPLADVIAGKYTPYAITLHNTSAYDLTTPFILVSNAETDTLWYEQGEGAAIFGTTLSPDERRTLTVHARFETAGRRQLRLSPDGKASIYESPLIEVAPFVADDVAVGKPELCCERLGEAQLVIPYTNSSSTRSGGQVTYCLSPGKTAWDDGEPRHVHYLYVPAHARQSDTVTFSHLTPGETYTLLVRYDWQPQQVFTFTLPTDLTSVVTPTAPASADTPAYGLDGRLIGDKSTEQVIIVGGNKHLRP
ncbi:MAG: C10 family peptidase [Bacteroidales bacterium]|nr:C10 family peptidase [Candidatus Equimonas enterica]